MQYAGMNFLEKAEKLIVLLIRDSVIMKKREKILVRTVDSDDVVILMGFLCNFYSHRTVSVSDSRRIININDCFKHVEKEKL